MVLVLQAKKDCCKLRDSPVLTCYISAFNFFRLASGLDCRCVSVRMPSSQTVFWICCLIIDKLSSYHSLLYIRNGRNHWFRSQSGMNSSSRMPVHTIWYIEPRFQSTAAPTTGIGHSCAYNYAWKAPLHIHVCTDKRISAHFRAGVWYAGVDYPPKWQNHWFGG